MGVKVAGLVAYLWVDKAITLVFSAFSALLALKMAGSDSITSMVIKKSLTSSRACPATPRRSIQSSA